MISFIAIGTRFSDIMHHYEDLVSGIMHQHLDEVQLHYVSLWRLN